MTSKPGTEAVGWACLKEMVYSLLDGDRLPEGTGRGEKGTGRARFEKMNRSSGILVLKI